jgi:class 3 adenylate cyclase
VVDAFLSAFGEPGGEPMQSEEKSLAIVFADVSGSTGLYETLGDTRAHALISVSLERMRQTVQELGGRVVKTVGDELICALNGADEAMRAASEMQSRLESSRKSDPAIPQIRVSIHYGSVLEVDGDVFGDTVNLCSRLAGLAKAGQILTSAPTVDALTPLLRSACRPLYAIDVRGKEDRVAVFEVLWKLDDTLTILSNTGGGMLAPGLINRLRLSHRQLDVLLDGVHRHVTVGRGADNAVVVESRTASRRHARVFVRDGKFVLVDESANGTFVRFDQQGEMMLRREETVLVGRGIIGLGESTGAGGEDLIAFEVL